VALENGYWKDKEINVEVQFGKGSTDTVKMVGVGQAEFGWANTVVTTHAIETGLPIKTIYGIYQKNSLGVMVFKDSGIRSAADFGGKKITMTGEGEEAILFPMWIKMNGVDPSDVERVLIGSREGRRSLFLENKVDGMWETLFSNIPVLQKQTDKKIEGISISDGLHPLNLLLQGIVVNTKIIQQDPEIVKDFLKGFKQGFMYSIEHPENAIDIMMDRVPEIQDREISLEILKSSFNFLRTNNSKDLPIGTFAKKDWDSTLEIMVKMGNLKVIEGHDKYYTNEFVPSD
jgi:NitT/TauT family transport system substrate-binding protein